MNFRSFLPSCSRSSTDSEGAIQVLELVRPGEMQESKDPSGREEPIGRLCLRVRFPNAPSSQGAEVRLA